VKYESFRYLVACVPWMAAFLVGCTSECPATSENLSQTQEYAFFPGDWVGNFGTDDAFLRLQYGTDNQCIVEQRSYLTPQSTSLCHFAIHAPCTLTENSPNTGFVVNFCVANGKFELLSDDSASEECKQYVQTQDEQLVSFGYGFTKRSDTEVVGEQFGIPYVMYKQ